MKVFYTGLRYNYYNPKKGDSFEYESFMSPLESVSGSTVPFFPFERILEVGKKQFNQELLEAVKKERPDALLCFMLSDEFEPEALEEMKKYTKTIAWFADDSWRFFNYSRIWAPHFTWVVTTYSWTPELFRRYGQPNVIRSQWAADISRYAPLPGTQFSEGGPDVTFIGGWSRPRARIVDFLKKRGIAVAAYGNGWPGGRVSSEDMIRLFTTSKINLGLNPSPGFFNKNSLGRLFFRRSLDKIVFDSHLIRNARAWLYRNIPQIKARHFEIPACGGFVLTSRADDLESYYAEGKEIVFYEGLEDLAQKIHYYLDHPEERKEIAKAAYERTIQNHTYEKRFKDIFDHIKITS